MKTTLIIFSVLIFLVLVTIHISIYFEYNLLENVGKIKVVLFKFIPIFISQITIAGEYLNFSKNKGKVIKLKIDLKDDNVQFFNDVSTNLKHKIVPIKLHTSALICFENPCLSAYIGSMLNIVVSVLFAQILTHTTDIDLQKNIQTGFRHYELRFMINIELLFSLYNFAWAILKAYKQKIRRKNEKKNQLEQGVWSVWYFR